MIISREEFTKYINRIHDLQKMDDEMRDWCHKWSPDTDIFFSQMNAECELVELLDKMTHPEDSYGDDVSYFVYELNFGEDYHPGCVTEADGTEIDFSTTDKLYDYLASLWEKKSE